VTKMKIKLLQNKVTLYRIRNRKSVVRYLGFPGLLGIAFENNGALIFCAKPQDSAALEKGTTGWRAILIEGIPGFDVFPGLLAKALVPLTQIGLSVLVVSSLSKDYIFFNPKSTQLKSRQIVMSVRQAIAQEFA
jgi:hypothetical protein